MLSVETYIFIFQFSSDHDTVLWTLESNDKGRIQLKMKIDEDNFSLIYRSIYVYVAYKTIHSNELSVI